MQLFALEQGRPIPARLASKKSDYQCPECRSCVRLRSGPHRQIHFYHIQKRITCRQHQKGLDHLHLQLHLLSLIEGGEIEFPFPTINRIADVVCHSKKIVYEIQCSPISLAEVEERFADYRSLGYEVIWILHAKQFNRRKLSAAESLLRENTCYFSDMDQKGEGKIYDQFDVVQGAFRLFKGPPLIVEPIALTPLSNYPPLSSPQVAADRFLKWKYSARGDLVDRLTRQDPAIVKRMSQLEKDYTQRRKKTPALPWKLLIFKSYQLLLHALLKKLSNGKPL